MKFKDVLDLLSTCTREELRDHAFGDTEVYWYTPEGHEVACGYDGSSGFSLTVYELKPTLSRSTHFDGEAAKGLRNVGKLGKVERNDEVGPDEFKQGQTMPGLTLEGVLEEITKEA